MPRREEDKDDYDGGKARKKRRRWNFIDDAAEEDDEEYGGGEKRKSGMQFLDLEAVVDSDEEDEDEDEAEDDFIVDGGADVPDDDDSWRIHRHREEDEQEDMAYIEDLERRLHERYGRREIDYDDEATEVDQQALLPSFRDPKLWMVKCAIGREREVAVCLMQKAIDKGPELQIRSVIALDHLKNYIYIEADKEAHVKEACKGMRNIYASAKIMLVPIREMTDVIAVKSKPVEISRDTWVRIKTGTYKGDLAKVVGVDNVRVKVTLKLVPRIDLQALAAKLGGRELVPKKKNKTFVPPQRFMNMDEARRLHIRVERRRDPMTGDYFQNIGAMKFKDGFLYKSFSMKSISNQNIQPTFDELEKFRQPSRNGDADVTSLSTLLANSKKGHFLKGDRVIVVKGDLKNLKGSVQKVEDNTVHIKPNEKGLPATLAISEKELCKYFEPGNHVKVVAGATEGAIGMVVSVEGHVINIVSDTTKELLRVFADDVVESSEVTTGVSRISEYELHDLVQLDDMSFGVIIGVESEAFHVLKGVPEKPEVALVRIREIKFKLVKKNSGTRDQNGNQLSVKDAVKILEGPCKGKQGLIEHIYRGILFVYDRHHLEHAGFICAKSESCALVGGSRANIDRNGGSLSTQFVQFRTLPRAPLPPMRSPRARGAPPIHSPGRFNVRGGRGHDNLVGAIIKICLGPHKGCTGIVKEVKGNNVRVELEAQMRVVTVNRDQINDNVNVSAPTFREKSRFDLGSETPVHPSRTPLRPFMTPMRDPGATPVHDGMRTPMRDRAWNPYALMSPPRDH